jgi:hypothetical protein
MRWALIGASAIAGEYMIRAIRAQEDGEILRVVSSSADRGAIYASEHGIPASGTDLDEALADARIDAVYISTTNEKHLAQALATIKPASLAGLAPVARQSGGWIGRAFIRGGRANLRQALFMPALVAARFNPALKAKYQMLIHAGKP